MQITLKLAAIIFAFAQLTFQCGNGCLKCSKPEVCDVCDFSNAFVLEEGKCVHKPQQDCLAYNLEGKCLSCKEGLYLNLDQQKCLTIQKYKVVDNCLHYTSQGNCSLCQSDFYLDGSICAPLENKIENCQIQNSQSTCQQCIDNYLLSVDQRKCVPVVEDSNCLGYSLNKCKTCNDSSIKDNTYYNTIIKQKAQDFNNVNQQFIFNYFSQQEHFYFETCINKQISNCALFQDFQTCTQCNQGYYLQDNKCIANPQNFINKCKRYQSINKCIECEHGFYLESDVSCKVVTPVKNCILYDGTSNKSQCKECEEKFYLQQDNTCVARTVEVQSCSLYATNNNLCSKCVDGMILSSDQKKCFLTIEKCQTYKSSSIDTTQILCASCVPGYYLLGNNCEVGSIVNCEIYIADQNVCQKCKNKYYLDGGICVLHNDINNCQTYSQSQSGKCITCKSGTAKFPKSTSCQAVVPIEGCLTYSDTNKCSRCMDGYNFVSDSKCDPIPSNTNCTYQEQGVCKQCNQGYFLANDSTCQLPIYFGLQFCDKYTIETNGFTKCQVCKPNSFSYVQTNNYVCKTADAIKRIYSLNTLKDNCKSFAYVNNQLTCNQCLDNFYLTPQNTCVDTCTNDLYRIKISQDNKIIQNYCEGTTSCKVFSTYQIFDQNKPNVCIQCDQNSVQKIDFTNTKNVIVESIDNLMTSKNDTLYLRPEIECQASQQLKVRSKNNTLVNNCDYYYDLHNGEIGCSKCQQGYNGLIKNWYVKNCIEYDNNTKQCTKCLNDYQLSQNGLECTKLNTINKCQRYKLNTQDVCELCETGYFLQDDKTCQQVTDVPNCQSYQIDQDKCLQCKQDFRFNQQKTFCYKQIQKCQNYNDPLAADDQAICTACEDGYYPINSGQNCEQGNVKHCWKYKQNMVNQCEYYDNNIPFENQNNCVQVNKMEGCVKYSDINTCTKCEPNSHYLSNNLCCPFRYFNTGSKCEQILIPNCKITNSLNSCQQCLSGYYEDIYQNEVNPPHVCCGLGSYWNPKELQCSSKLDVQLNQVGCDLFSENLLKCVHCKQNYYLSTKRFCCPYQQYHAIENNKNVCKPIPDTIKNCIEYDGFTPQCTKCVQYKQGDQFEYFLGTNSKKCCKKDHEADTNNGCVPNLAGCKTVNANNAAVCDTCRDNYQKETGICCAKKDGTQKAEIYDANTQKCVEVAQDKLIQDCVYYKIVNNVYECQECSSQFVLSNSNKNCCPINTVYVISKCIDTKFIYDQCAEVNNTTNLCKSCKTGYYLHNGVCVQNGKVFSLTDVQIKDGSKTDCIKYENFDATNQEICKTCKTGFTLQADKTCLTQMSVEVQQVKYEYADLIKGCAYFNIENSKCEICQGGYYKKTADIMCCKFGEKLASNKCQAMTDQTCKTLDDNSNCNSRLSTTLSNCKTSVDNQSCTECNFGYYLNAGQCKSQADVNKVCSYFDINSNCMTVDLTNCTCSKCESWAYGEHCCEFGKKWNSNNKQCELISTDQYCAKWDSTNNKCDTCFFDMDLKTISDNYKWQYLNTDKSYVSSNDSNSYPQDFNIWKNTNGVCCPLYQGIKDNICQFSTITNCRKPIYSNNIWTCSECNYGYKKLNQDKNCCLNKQKFENGNCVADNTVTDLCPTGQYVTNSQCCLTGQYFNKEDSKCHPIIDKNCTQSNEGNSCTTACATNFNKRNYMQSTLAEINIQDRPQGKAFYKKQYIYLCQQTATLSKWFNGEFTKKITTNCLEIDAANKKCKTCKNGYYMQTNGPMCCANNQTLVTLKEGNEIQEGYCYAIADLLTNCEDYDITNKICKKCLAGKNLSKGRCCDANKHFNIQKSICEFDSTNCELYDGVIGKCRLCKFGYHLSNDKCIVNTKYNKDGTAIDVQNEFSNCSKVTDSNKHECLEVVTNSNSYIHRGRACQLGQYNDGNECKSISLLGQEFQNCLELDHTNNCQNCNTNYYYSNGKCCQDKEYFEPFIKKCIPIYKYRNCKQASFDKSKNCEVCEDGYYVGAHGFCVQEGKKIDDVYGTVSDIQITNCTQMTDNNQCIKCSGTKVIYDNQCLDYQDISTLQRIGGCRIIKAGTTPTCLECESNYYLTNNDQRCCQFGTYFDGTNCTSLQQVSLNCKTYEFGTCKQCQDNFYLSNNIACCQEGQYAQSATSCQQIDLQNCLRSNNNGVCDKCAPNFKLFNGQCITLTGIDNCLIGADVTKCLICKDGFYLNDQSQCTAQDNIVGCATKTTNKNTCQTCQNGLYYDGHQCCAFNKYSRITGVVDQQGVYQCELLQPLTQTNCERIDNDICTSCGTDKYLFNNQCCPYGQYHDGNSCVNSTKTGLVNCKIFKDANTCQQTLNIKGQDESCLNQKYYHKGHCCSSDQYWNSTTSACEATSNVTAYKNCQQLNDQMKCTKCSSGYLSNGLCCDEGKYNVQGVCTTITGVTNCSQYDGTFCSKCSTGNLSSFNRCCSQLFYFSDNSCNDITDANEFNIFDEQLINCNNNKYPASAKLCCPVGQYDSNGTCTDLTNKAACDQVHMGSGDNTCAVCKVVDQNSAPYVAVSNACYTSTEFPLFYNNGAVVYKATRSTLITDCQQMNENGLCSQCKNNKNVSEGICLDKKYLKVDDLQNIAETAIVTDCLIGTATTCSLCDTGKFLTQDKSACCADKIIPTDASTCGTTSTALITNCIEFVKFTSAQDYDANVHAKQCKTCKDNYYKYTNSDSTIITCCPEGQKPQTDNQQCEVFGYNIDKCSKFNHLTNSCEQCKAEVNNVKYYLSLSNVCCPEGQYYNATNKACENIDTNTYPDCSQVKTINNASACAKCTTGKYFTGANKDKCCNYGKVHDGNNCVDFTVTNCKEGTAGDDCTTCQNDYLRIIESNKGKCCKEGQYHNNGCKDISADKNCLKVPDNVTNDNTCAVCKAGYILASDSKTCCQPNDITGNSCKKSQQLYQTDVLKYCGKWDRKSMQCIDCQEAGYYASNGGCCLEGKYSQVNTNSFSCVNITINDCKRYDSVNGCTKCSSGFILNKSKSNIQADACVSQTIVNGWLGCLQVDNNLTKCSKCEQGYYLHKDKCVQVGKKRNLANNNSEDMTITNCLQMKSNSDTECDLCKNEYYLTLTKTFCCKEGTYLLNNQCVTEGGANDPKPIENCSIFNDNPEICNKCKFGYVKGTKLAGKHICLKFRENLSEEICEEATVSISNSKNTFNCTKCMNHEIDYVLRNSRSERIINYQSIPGCQYYDTQVMLTQSSLQCKVCQDNNTNYLKDGVCQPRVITNLNKCTGQMIYNQDLCNSCQTGYYLDNNQVCQEIPVTNCKLYNGTQCQICNEGFKLMKQNNNYNCVDVNTFTENLAQTPTFYKGYINECTQQQECVNFYVGGIDQTLTKLFSCHLCNFKDMIPFVSVKTTSANNETTISSIQRYKKSLNGETQDQGEELNSSQCLKPISDTFNIQSNQFNFPNNCSLGMINSSLTPTAFESNSATASPNNLGIYCVACKPGYKPYYGQVKHQVYKCENISNCKVIGDNFNQCKQCNDGYVFEYDANTKLIKRDVCKVYTVDQNCLAGNFNDPNNITCSMCKRGFSLNKAGFCEQTLASNCQQGKFERYDNNQLTKQNMEEFILRFRLGEGCQECENNYHKILETGQEHQCEYSPVVKEKKVYSNTQAYQSNCLQYENNGQHKCVKCLDNSVLNIYGTCLNVNTPLTNCALAENQDLCKTCDNGYVKINNLCVVKDIDNCEIYIENPDDGKKRCSQCQKGYGLEDGLCAKDLFNSCVRVDKQGNCTNCQEGFHLVTLKNDKKACIEVVTHQNCAEYQSVNFQNFDMRCQKCLSNQFVLKEDSLTEVCNPIPTIKNCKTYDIGATFGVSSLSCLECKVGYYLLNKECIPRLNKIIGCLDYEFDSQLCKQCDLDYYLSDNKKQCIENPKGIQNCQEYKSQTECAVCKTQYYILEGECKSIDTKNVVQMCEIYDQDQKCMKCASNYILGANVCESVLASNCLQIQSRTECKSCSFGFKLETVENITSCVQIKKESIPNCKIVSDTTPFVCIKCEDNYYVLDGKCQAVEKKIPLCKEYDSPVICSKCDNYSILSADRTICSSLINQNCLEAEEQKEGFCVVCQPGYVLKQGKCEFMTGAFENAAENCMVYQDQPQNQKLECFICKKGYSMNELGSCERTKMNNQDTTVPDQPNESDNTSNIMIYSIINYTLWFFYAFF